MALQPSAARRCMRLPCQLNSRRAESGNDAASSSLAAHVLAVFARAGERLLTGRLDGWIKALRDARSKGSGLA